MRIPRRAQAHQVTDASDLPLLRALLECKSKFNCCRGWLPAVPGTVPWISPCAAQNMTDWAGAMLGGALVRRKAMPAGADAWVDAEAVVDSAAGGWSPACVRQLRHRHNTLRIFTAGLAPSLERHEHTVESRNLVQPARTAPSHPRSARRSAILSVP